ncbi:MAG: hypothetical protein KKF44_10780 [Nanoarchaeota archaeon]|nr:hypothetical protein [Nanoarchaeota archaeon]
MKKNPRTVFFINTNGRYIADYGLGPLKRLHNVYYNVSVDGLKNNHDEIRWDGSFEEIGKTFEHLKKAKKYFGAAVTIRPETREEIVSIEFFEQLLKWGEQQVQYQKLETEECSRQVSHEEYGVIGEKIRQRQKNFPVWVFYRHGNDGHGSWSDYNYIFVDIDGNIRNQKMQDQDDFSGNVFEIDDIQKHLLQLIKK